MRYERIRRIWQNPFYLKQWNDFWCYIAIDSLMSLYDKPTPSLILYSSDLLQEDKEKIFQEAEKIVADAISKR